MEEIVFKSQEELFARIMPALRSKKKMLKKKGFTNILESDIWDFMRLHKWANSHGLELCDMVDDILHTDEQLIVDYSINKYVPKKDDMSFELPKLNEIILPKKNIMELPKLNDIEIPRLKS